MYDLVAHDFGLPESLGRGPHVVTRYLSPEHREHELTCWFHRHRRQGEPITNHRHFGAEEHAPGPAEAGEPVVYGVTYVLDGHAVVPDGPHTRLSAGHLYQWSGTPQTSTRLDLSPGFFEAGIYLDSTTGAKLADLHIWNSRIHHADIGKQVTLVQEHLALFRAIEDLGESTGAIMRRLCAQLERIDRLCGGLSAEERFLQDARRLLSQRMEPTFGMEQAAFELGMSYASFRKRFKALMGISPGAYQVQCRMEHACRLLQQQGVHETAHRLGYRDAHVFSRQFKQYIGTSPSAWQQAYRAAWR